MRRLFVALVCTQVVHSTEEIIFGFNRRTPEIGAQFQKIISCFPIVSISATVFILLNIALVSFLAASVLLVYRGTKWASRIIIAVGMAEFFNGAAHMTMAAVSGGYFPGAVSAVGLLIVSILLLRSMIGQGSRAEA